MVTDQTHNAVWISLFDIERLVRYYEILADRYSRRQGIVRFILLLTALSGIVSFLDVLPPLFQVITGALLAVCVAVDYVLHYGEKAATLRTISWECSRLATEWKALWGDLEFITDEECRQRDKRLMRRLDEVTTWAGLVQVRDDDDLNLYCEKVAARILELEYVRERTNTER